MRRKVLAVFGGAALGALLSGCVETGPGAGPVARLDVKAAIAEGTMRSPRGAAIALSSLEGAPEPVATRLRQEFLAQAAARQVTVSDPAQARYFLRGYLDAYDTDDGAAVRWVWDVFDADKQRSIRIEDGYDAPRSGDDPWATVDGAAIDGIASRSADAVATYLSTTPAAVAVN